MHFRRMGKTTLYVYLICIYIYINIYHVGMFWCPVGACMIVYVQIPNMGNFGWLVAGWRKKTAKSSKKRSFQWNECKHTFIYIYIYTQGIVFWLLCARFCPPYQNLEWVVLCNIFTLIRIWIVSLSQIYRFGWYIQHFIPPYWNLECIPPKLANDLHSKFNKKILENSHTF